MLSDLRQPFFFLRHGETDWNAEGRAQGRLDIPLNATGRSQALAAADAFAGHRVRRIVSSPLARAWETAVTVGERLGLEPEPAPDLREVHLGVQQGSTYGGWRKAFWRGDYVPPGGESLDAFRARVARGIAAAAGEGPDVLIVAHGGVWKALRGIVPIESELVSMPNALPLRLVPGPDAWQCAALAPAPEGSDAPRL